MLAVSARNFGQRPSDLLSVEDEATALDFDLACGTCLRFYDLERENLLAAKIATETIKKFGEAFSTGTDESASEDSVDWASKTW